MIYWIRKFFSDGDAHWKAFCEVFTVTAFTLVLYVGSFIKARAAGISSISDRFMDRGEIFLLIYALFGTLFYLAFIHVGKPANGPKKFFGLLVSVIIIPIVLMSGFDPTFKFIVDEQINTAGYYVFSTFLFSYYALLFFQELEPPNPEDVLDQGARSMARKARGLGK